MNYFIKNLTPHQQVGLLFVFVFGLLFLATVVTVIRTFRFTQQSKNGPLDDDDTVRAHLRNIYEKLHVRGRTEAVRMYLKSPGLGLGGVGGETPA